MPIDQFDFESLGEADLKELVEGAVPEGLHIEYKRDLYGQEAAQKKEALKDISAFANAGGGHLIIGISENKGVPESLSGVDGVNPDSEILRLQSMARSGIEPEIQGLKMRAIPVNGGRHCFVIRVPRSWNPPHRVCTERTNRYFIRDSNAVHEASMDELRALFTQEANALERAIEFRDQRLEKIISGEGRRPLQGGGRLILHIIPLVSLLTRYSIDLEQAKRCENLFRPIGASAAYSQFNFNGLAVLRHGDHNNGYTQVFRNGIVEATYSSLLRAYNGMKIIPGVANEQFILESSASYLDALRRLGVPAPLLVLVTFEGVEGAVFLTGLQNQHRIILDGDEPPIEDDRICLSGCYIQAYGNDDDYHQALRPAIDVLWNMSGHPSAGSFDENGHWLNGRRRAQ